MPRPILLAVAGFLLAAVGAAQDAAKADLDKLQGRWVVVALTESGKEAPKDSVKGDEFVVKGSQYTMKTGKDTYRGGLKLDAGKTPKQIDATFIDDQGKEQGKALGIYELSGDRLKICWKHKGERPTTFASPPDSGVRLMELKRDRP